VLLPARRWLVLLGPGIALGDEEKISLILLLDLDEGWCQCRREEVRLI
jgi:hypothetical protein